MSSAWYALAVHVRSEARALRDVSAWCDDVFLPVRRERRVWSDRIEIVETPLLPGYLFVRTHMTPAQRVRLLRATAVVDVVRASGERAGGSAIPDEQMLALQRVVASERAVDPVDRLVRGVSVRVVRGALRGVVGRIEQGTDGQKRLVCTITLLGRGVRTVLSADDVIEVSESSMGLAA